VLHATQLIGHPARLLCFVAADDVVDDVVDGALSMV